MANTHNESSNEYFYGFWGVAIHLIVLWGVLDANFHSPVLSNLPPVPPLEKSPAKRLFLFVADGLRYRTFSSATPNFFRNIMENEGVWGISHTRVPTESRPGNVAIAAGLYEDPSALFKGWKENPVDFDSVFNRSRVTYAWGSPDIIPMFVKGSHGNVHGFTYPQDWQNFDKSSNSPKRLDSWVFDQYDKWLETDAKNVKTENGMILFFHLLGCDTAGHASKPTSSEYQSEMSYVAEKIQQAVKKGDEFFDDNESVYIFTSDHGMTEWGSHGGGSKDETETPFVAWGAGIDQSSQQKDIKQADIAPLISSLIGISIPTNNEGILPRFYLKSSNDQYGLKATLNNIKQLIIQVKANRALTSGDSVSTPNWREQELNEAVNIIENLLKENKIRDGLSMADAAIENSRVALYHYRQLQRNQLIIYLTLLWIGWIVLLIFKLIGTKRERLDERNKAMTPTILVNAVFSIAVVLLIVEHNVSGRRDWRILGYGMISFFSIFLACRKASMYSVKFETSSNSHAKISIGCTIVLIIIISAGIINKYFFSLAMVIAALMQKTLIKNPDRLLVPSALVLAVYPLLPTLKPQANEVMILAPLIVTPLLFPKTSPKLMAMEIVKLLLTVLIVTEVIDGRNGFSWIILISTPLCILMYPTENQEIKLAGVISGLVCPLTLLSASYEPQVFCLLGLHLIALLNSIKKEEEFLTIKMSKNRRLNLQDLVTAVYFMLYILLSFFGTGNMASISSFDPMWTRHFITVFSPFTMTILILLKLAFPLILVGCASRVLVSQKTFLAVLLLGDCLSLPLMYSVTSQGSWLDIGTAISRYTISITLPCLFFVLYYISSPLMLFSLIETNNYVKKQHLI